MGLLVLPDDSEAATIISAKNRLRQYDFLHDTFQLWQSGHPIELDHRFIYELNFYATQYLSSAPGQYRSVTKTNVTVGKYTPPPWEQVNDLMDDMIKRLNSLATKGEPMETASYALWRLNHIHPFVQGNGRTARALSYFVLCQKFNHWFSGQTIPERIRASRDEYCQLLAEADGAADKDGWTNLDPIKAYLGRLLTEQLATT